MSFDHQDSRADDIDMSDDDGSSQLLGEKKRRLNMEQVKALERSFEIGNKLEPERKMQLARALGLKPRQIAIWFQNRRARCKTKQLEKDYEILKRQCDKLKSDNDALKTQNKNLHSEVSIIKRFHVRINSTKKKIKLFFFALIDNFLYHAIKLNTNNLVAPVSLYNLNF